MKSFEYAKARSVDGAIQLSTSESRFLGGGIDLLGEMKEYIVSPKRVIDLKTIPNLDRIDTSTETWKLGANVRIAEIARNDQIRATLPGLAEAAAEVGSPQIRNVATLGGNLAQHSRCWYYRHRDLRCLKRGGEHVLRSRRREQVSQSVLWKPLHQSGRFQSCCYLGCTWWEGDRAS